MNSNALYLTIAIIIMTGITYLCRVVPLLLFRKKITNKWFLSFLYYVPYNVLAAMAFPAILESTGSLIASIAGTVVAIILGFFRKNLLVVALGAAATAFVVGLFI